VPRVQAIDLKERLTFDIRDTWQARVLVAAQSKTEGVIGAVALSVIAHNYDDALLVLLQTIFPGFQSIQPPALCTAGRIDKSGAVVANLVERSGRIVKDYQLYRDEIALRDDFRRLADELKLDDSDRIELFICLQRWVVADRRLDPTMDPKDPDAKRLVN
jgi:hypothetical protein